MAETVQGLGNMISFHGENSPGGNIIIIPCRKQSKPWEPNYHGKNSNEGRRRGEGGAGGGWRWNHGAHSFIQSNGYRILIAKKEEEEKKTVCTPLLLPPTLPAQYHQQNPELSVQEPALLDCKKLWYCLHLSTQSDNYTSIYTRACRTTLTFSAVRAYNTCSTQIDSSNRRLFSPVPVTCTHTSPNAQVVRNKRNSFISRALPR